MDKILIYLRSTPTIILLHIFTMNKIIWFKCVCNSFWILFFIFLSDEARPPIARSASMDMPVVAAIADDDGVQLQLSSSAAAAAVAAAAFGCGGGGGSMSARSSRRSSSHRRHRQNSPPTPSSTSAAANATTAAAAATTNANNPLSCSSHSPSPTPRCQWRNGGPTANANTAINNNSSSSTTNPTCTANERSALLLNNKHFPEYKH